MLVGGFDHGNLMNVKTMIASLVFLDLIMHSFRSNSMQKLLLDACPVAKNTNFSAYNGEYNTTN